MNLTKPSTFQMLLGNLMAGSSMSTYQAGVTGSDFQPFDWSRSIRRMTKIFPVFGHSFAFESIEDWTIDIDLETVTAIEVTNDSFAWKAIVAGQADQGAIFRLSTNQWARLQNSSSRRIHIRMYCV